MPNIFQFKSYRPFLKAIFEHHRSANRKYSLIYFSGRIGHSASYLKLVLSGKRELTVDSAALLGKALKLNALERDYLICLALRESASSPALRAYAANRLLGLKQEGLRYHKGEKLLAVFQNSLLWELFSLVGVEGFTPEPRWILPRLRRSSVTSGEIAGALKQLETLGAIRFENGRARAGDVVFKHGFDLNRVYSVAAQRLVEHLRGFPGDPTAYFDSFCLILSEQEYEQIREILEETKLKIGAVARGRSAPKTRIAYFNSSLFWASV